MLKLVEDSYSDTASILVSVFEQSFRQFLRNADIYERSQEGDREEAVNYFRNVEIEGLSLIQSLKNNSRNAPLNHEVKRKKSVKVFNIKVSSHSMKKRTLQCPYCSKTYNSVTLKPLQLHIRQNHEGQKQITAKDVPEEEEKVACHLLKPNGNICGKKTTCDMMVRHILSKKLHKTPQIAPEGKDFYGFQVSSESHPEPSVVWLSPDEEEPPEEEIIELEGKESEEEKVETDTLTLPDSYNQRLNSESEHVGGDEVLSEEQSNAHPQDEDTNTISQPVQPECGDDRESEEVRSISLDVDKVVVEAEKERSSSDEVPADHYDEEAEVMSTYIHLDSSNQIDDIEFGSSSIFVKENSHKIVLSGLINYSKPQIPLKLIGPKSPEEPLQGPCDGLPCPGENIIFETGDTTLFPEVEIHAENQNTQDNDDHKYTEGIISQFQLDEENVFTIKTMSASALSDEVLNSRSLTLNNNDADVNILLQSDSELADQLMASVETQSKEDLMTVALEIVEPKSFSSKNTSQQSIQEDLSPFKSAENVKDKILNDNLPVHVQLVGPDVDNIVSMSIKKEVESTKKELTKKPKKKPTKKPTKSTNSKNPAVMKTLEVKQKRSTKRKKTKEDTELGLAEQNNPNKRIKEAEEDPARPAKKKASERLKQNRSSKRKKTDETEPEVDKQKKPDQRMKGAEDEELNAPQDLYTNDEEESLESEIIKERQKVRQLGRNHAEDERPLSDLPENSTFIKELMNWLRAKTALSTTNKEPSTFTHTLGHGFEWSDSWLNYMVGQNPTFNLSRLIDFKSKENYLSMTSPVSWLNAASKCCFNPNRQKSQLEVHARIRDFVEHKLMEADLSGNDLLLRLAVSNNLKDISAQVSKLGLFQKLKKKIEVERAHAKRMKLLLDPTAEQKEFECVKTWFNSPESKELEKEAETIYRESMKSGNVDAAPFNRFACICRFTWAVKDKNRPSVYNFSVQDYLSKISCWLPEGDESIWSINQLPDGWRMYEEPNPPRPPSCFEIRLDGTHEQVKGQNATTIIIDRKSYKMGEQYRELRRLRFGQVSPSDPFFVNARGLKLSRLQRNRGSLVELFGKVTNVTDFTMTSLRKSAEGKIQSDSNLSNLTKDLNNHSNQVVPVYDNMASSRRNLFISSTNQEEDPAVPSTSGENDDFKKLYDEAKKSDEPERLKIEEEARKFIEERKKKKHVADLTPSPLDDGDLDFLRTVFSEDETQGMSLN